MYNPSIYSYVNMNTVKANDSVDYFIYVNSIMVSNVNVPSFHLSFNLMLLVTCV